MDHVLEFQGGIVRQVRCILSSSQCAEGQLQQLQLMLVTPLIRCLNDQVLQFLPPYVLLGALLNYT
jgi:hypothetical protein